MKRLGVRYEVRVRSNWDGRWVAEVRRRGERDWVYGCVGDTRAEADRDATGWVMRALREVGGNGDGECVEQG